MLLSEFITFPERVSVYFTMTMSVKRPIKGPYFQYLLYIYVIIYYNIQYICTRITTTTTTTVERA